MSKDTVTCKVTGLAGVSEGLLGLEQKIARNLLRKALKNVGTFWVDAVKSHVPVLDGDLRDSIAAKVTTRKGKAKTGGLPVGSVTVGPSFIARSDGKNSVGPGVYGMFVEFGLKNKKKYKKHAFLRPTFDSTKETVVDVFADTLRNGLADALKND
jgi:HK97 gp10 family phage protein